MSARDDYITPAPADSRSLKEQGFAPRFAWCGATFSQSLKSIITALQQFKINVQIMRKPRKHQVQGQQSNSGLTPKGRLVENQGNVMYAVPNHALMR